MSDTKTVAKTQPVNALAALRATVPAETDKAAIADLITATTYLQRLQLYSKGNAVDRKLIAGGQWGVPQSADEITVIGESLDVLVLAYKPKALDLSNPKKPVSNFDPTSDEFIRIKKQAGVKDSGCMYGISFLVFERSTKMYLELYAGTVSLRKVAKDIMTYTPEENTEGDLPALTLGSKLVTNDKKQSWFVPTTQDCSTPIELPADAAKQREEFLNPPERKSSDEAASDAETAATSRAR